MKGESFYDEKYRCAEKVIVDQIKGKRLSDKGKRLSDGWWDAIIK